MNAAVNQLDDSLGKLGAEAALFDHHGQESGAENVHLEPGHGLEGVVSFASRPVSQKAVQVGMPLELVAVRLDAEETAFDRSEPF